MTAASIPARPAPRRPVNYGAIAHDVMFGGTLDYARHGVMLRKGKTVEDVKAALRKAQDMKNGMARTEVELSTFALYLKDVLKARPDAAAPSAPATATA